MRGPACKTHLTMHSSYGLILVVFTIFHLVTAGGSPRPRFFNGSPPRHTANDRSSITSASPSIEQSTSTTMPEPLTAFPSGGVACVPSIETFNLIQASISACADRAPGEFAKPTNQTRPDIQNSTKCSLETFEFKFLNPSPNATEISCHLTWDTSIASPDKYPIAKQMFCDHDSYNQFNAVLEKQASGILAGFYLFVWNK